MPLISRSLLLVSISQTTNLIELDRKHSFEAKYAKTTDFFKSQAVVFNRSKRQLGLSPNKHFLF